MSGILFIRIVLRDSLGRHRLFLQRFRIPLRTDTYRSQWCSRSGCSIRKYYYHICYIHRCQRSRCSVQPRDQADRCNDTRLVDSRKSGPCRTRAFLPDIRLCRCSTVQTRGPRYNRARRSLWTRICKISPHLIRVVSFVDCQVYVYL